MKTLNDEVTATYTFLGFRYIRMLNPWSLQPVQPRIPLLCVHCKRTLSYTDQILCTKRRWSFGTASAQNACYMNTVRLENINVGSFREERLAQGRFIMGDMNCVCGAIVGYKFCKDLTRDSRNIYQVGRFGLVSSCFVVSQQTCLDCD
ncbi:hypothetical protein DIPPA_13739 [Diplonema papillatum]|nr:hypothetical protein DIPPA_13739 [Diplonema papillatum]